MAPFKNNDWWIRINKQYAAGVPEKYFQEFRRSFQELDETGFTNLMIENQRFRIPAGLERIQVPALIVCGQNEYDAMRQSARDLAGTLPNARAYTIQHHHKLSLAEEHNWNMTAPELFTAMLRAWLSGQPLPGELRPVGLFRNMRK